MRWVTSGTVTYDAGSPKAGRYGTDSWGRKRIFVGIGGLAACAEPDIAIQTMALGSCVGIMAYDRARGITGMAHVALPDSAYDGARAAEEPGRYADTALPSLLAAMGRLGCDATGQGMVFVIAGGASILGDAGLFDIGKRNQTAVGESLRELGLRLRSSDVGGTHSRTVVLEPDGRVQVTCPGRDAWYL